ncbi:hypothetical protein BGX30_007589, partial [Mortierella sp. GBA39]
LNAVRIQAADFLGRRVMRNNHHVAAAGSQFAQNTALGAVVDKYDPLSSARAAVSMLRGHARHLIGHQGARSKTLSQLLDGLSGCRQNPLHRAVAADQAGQHARIDVADADDPVFLQQRIHAVLGAPVARHRFMAAYDKSVHIWRNRLKIVARNAVVADQRERHRDDLPAVRRVRQHLLISRNPCIKHDFARRFTFCSESTARKQCSVLQQQSCLHPTHSSVKLR